MIHATSFSSKTSLLFRLLAGLLVLTFLFSSGAVNVLAQDGDTLEEETEYFKSDVVTLPDGTELVEVKLMGPSSIPAGMAEPQTVDMAAAAIEGSVILTGVPSYNWVFGAAATSGGMIAGYYDRHGFPEIYTGPTNAGVVPLDSSLWGTWTDAEPWTYPDNPLVATRNGSDGRVVAGTIDDYWVIKGSTAPDPYITGSLPQHAWGDAVGDYMKTSQSLWANKDGQTTFWFNSDGSPLTCQAVADSGRIGDGALGLKQFYVARGYTVGTCFSQFTDNKKLKDGFTYAEFKQQIDNGHPVMIHLEGHTLIGIGYSKTTEKIYLYDTWDANMRSMTWGGKYLDMEMLAVSIVIPVPTNDKITSPIVLDAIPSEYRQTTVDATYTVGQEPTFIDCGQALGYASVWYVFNPVANGELSIDTFGSNYDTMLGAWEGIPGTLTPIVCNNNARNTLQSQISFQYTGGDTYYIGIAQKGTAQTGGNLKLQVTSFFDVPSTYPLWRYVEGFYKEGISGGCAVNPLRYCPNRGITRGEMAVFILRAMNGAAYVPVDNPADPFTDVPTVGKEWMEHWIEDFYASGITSGCALAPLRYCPERGVTRGEMAVFLLRAIHGPAYVPVDVDPDPFIDVPVVGKEWMEPWIEQVYVQGYTSGCSGTEGKNLRYCPGSYVTRAQMAAFLSRAYSFTPLPEFIP